MNHGTLPETPAGFAHGFTTVNGLRFHRVEGGAESARTIVLRAGFPRAGTLGARSCRFWLQTSASWRSICRARATVTALSTVMTRRLSLALA